MTLMRRKEHDVSGAPVYLRDEMNRLFDNFFNPGLPLAREPFRGDFLPAIDISETPQGITIQAEIPGVKPEEVEVNINGGILTLRGEKKDDQEQKGRNWHRLERSYGSFLRAIQLPETVDAEKCTATHANGVLKIEIAKKETSKPRQIPVEIKR